MNDVWCVTEVLEDDDDDIDDESQQYLEKLEKAVSIQFNPWKMEMVKKYNFCAESWWKYLVDWRHL